MVMGLISYERGLLFSGGESTIAVNAGNAADPATGSLYGSVPYVYQMGKYDVTVGQYCQFLNAVAATTPTGCTPATNMAYPTVGIVRSGSPAATRTRFCTTRATGTATQAISRASIPPRWLRRTTARCSR